MALPAVEEVEIEEELDGTKVEIKNKIQLIEGTIEDPEDLNGLQEQAEDWSDVKVGVYIVKQAETPGEKRDGISGGGNSPCIQAGATTPVNTPVTSTPKEKEESSADAAASINPNNTGIKIGVNTSGLNELQVEIVNTALEWLKKGVPGQKWEDAGGRGPLVDELKKQFGWKPGSDAWCAMFCSVVIRDAMAKVQAKGIATKDQKKAKQPDNFLMIAGARLLVYSNSKPPLLGGASSTTPEIGAIFHTPPAPGADGSGHVGIVVGIDGPNGQVITCEGNASDRVCLHVSNAAKVKTMRFAYPGRLPHSGKSRGSDTLKEIPDLLKTAYLVGGKYKTR